MREKKYQLSILFLLLLCIGCLQEELLVAKADFVFEETITSSGKIAIISNLSTGGETFEWTFENGNPSSSSEFNPGQISFTTPGTHILKLKVSNRDGSVSEIEKNITVDANAVTDFNYNILINNYAPVEVQISNISQNIATYDWQFSNGTPANSTDVNPSNVIFNTPGQQTITLNTISTTGQIGQKEVTFEVLPELDVDFDFYVLPIDEDNHAPVKVFITNTTISATSYSWEVIGANPETSTLINPSFILNSEGNYQIKLTATNGKQTASLIKDITILSYTNLSIQNDILLGINTAQNTIGSYYSTVQKQVYRSNEIDGTNGNTIDIVYFGLSSTFSSNLFISPLVATNYGLISIPNANDTNYINKQENCTCPIISESQFNSITNDTFLQTITVTNEESSFNSTLSPRIIPFETSDGRKGLIKVKSFINDGTNSYVIVDIKVQKRL